MPLLDRIVASLSVVTPGLHYDMEFLIGTPSRRRHAARRGNARNRAAGAFARAMTARGTPPDSVSIAIRPGDPREVALRFFVRPRDELRLQFDRTIGRREASP